MVYSPTICSRLIRVLFAGLLLVTATHCNNVNAGCVSPDPSCDILNLVGLYGGGESAPAAIYFIRSSSPLVFGRVDLATNALTEFSGDFPSSPASIAVDSTNGVLYYSIDSNTSIRRIGLDGSGVTVFATDASANNIIGLYLDEERDRLYWWNVAGQMRYVNQSDGSGQTLVRTFATAMVVGEYDRAAQLWYAAGGTEVRTMPDDATSESLINSAGNTIVDLDLIDENRLVAADIPNNEVTVMNRDGSGRATLVGSVMPGGQDYASSTNTLYTCDQTNDRIDQLNLTTGEQSTLLQLSVGYNPVACSIQFSTGLL